MLFWTRIICIINSLKNASPFRTGSYKTAVEESTEICPVRTTMEDLPPIAFYMDDSTVTAQRKFREVRLTEWIRLHVGKAVRMPARVVVPVAVETRLAPVLPLPQRFVPRAISPDQF